MEPSGEQYKQLGVERRLQLQEMDTHNMSLAPDLYYLSDFGKLSNCFQSSFLSVQNNYNNNNLEDMTMASQWKLSNKW